MRKQFAAYFSIVVVLFFNNCTSTNNTNNTPNSTPEYKLQSTDNKNIFIHFVFADSSDVAAIDLSFSMSDELPYIAIVNNNELYYSDNDKILSIGQTIKNLTLIIDYSSYLNFYIAYTPLGKKHFSISEKELPTPKKLIVYNNKWEQFPFTIIDNKSTPAQHTTTLNHLCSSYFKNTMRIFKNQNDSTNTTYTLACTLQADSSIVFYKKETNTLQTTSGKVKQIISNNKSTKLLFEGKQHSINGKIHSFKSDNYTLIIDSAKCVLGRDTLYFCPDNLDFVDMRTYPGNYTFDIKYATTDNFTGQKLYNCDACLLRYIAVQAIEKANQIFTDNNMRIRFYDCYRPVSAQKKMWEVFPNRIYVANPYEGGSMHNRGIAVDISLTDSSGKLIDMGVPFDYFGVEAHPYFQGFPDLVKKHRMLLVNTMLQSGFTVSRSEYWHYSLANYSIPLSDAPLPCNGTADK